MKYNIIHVKETESYFAYFMLLDETDKVIPVYYGGNALQAYTLNYEALSKLDLECIALNLTYTECLSFLKIAGLI